jgi:hypothetical protein
LTTLEVLERELPAAQSDAQPCQICARLNSHFGYGPPSHEEIFWRCGAHRVEGPVQPAPRWLLETETPVLIERMIDDWLTDNWPRTIDGNCHHCRGEDDGSLIPHGYGPLPKIWTHRRCSDVWRETLRLQARQALGFDR